MTTTRPPADDMAETFGLPHIAPPDVLEATEYRDMALQAGNTDIQVSESAYYPPAQQERRND